MYQIIKLLGEPWRVTKDGNPVVFQKLIYKCWIESQIKSATLCSVAFDDEQPITIPEISVDIQSSSHRVVGDCSHHIRVFAYIPTRDEDENIPSIAHRNFILMGLIQSIHVEADISKFQDLFTMDLTFSELSTSHWAETVRWDMQNLDNKTDYKPSLFSRFDFAKGLTK